jgi:chorismate mutase
MPDLMLSKTLQDLIACLEADLPAVPEEPTTEHMAPWRDRIDALDQIILHLLNERAVCANAIGHIKKQVGLPIYAPGREQEVLQNVISSNNGPLSNTAIKHVFERIIDETRSQERQMFQDGIEPEQN